MKPEPLKNKWSDGVNFNKSKGKIIATVDIKLPWRIYTEKDIRSAIEWLKQKINSTCESGSPKCHACKQNIGFIEKAFPDILEVKK